MNKSNRLTLFIFIAMLLGIVLGIFLNINTIVPKQQKLKPVEAELKKINQELSLITDTVFLSAATFDATLLQLEKKKKLIASLNKIKEEKSNIEKSINEPLNIFVILSDIFLRLIKMIIAPLVLSTLIVGIGKVGDLGAVGRIGGKTMLWFLCATFVSLSLGLILVNFYQPGLNMHLELPDKSATIGVEKSALNIKDFITHLVPKSIFEALAHNEILQIIIFSIFFGIACAAIGEPGKILLKAIDAFSHVMLKITAYVMNFAPIAVFAAMANTIALQGLGVLKTYGIFIVEFYSALLLLWIILLFLGFLWVKKRIFSLVRHLKDPFLLAFSTASSEAALPKTMQQLERFGCDNKIVSFVLPLGYSFNLDGSMMYMTFASMFIAQSYGIDMPLSSQISMLLILMLTSKGIAGVPRASLVVISGALATFHIPEAGLLLLMGVDQLLDMGRSATNVLGNAVATVAVSKWEKALED